MNFSFSGVCLSGVCLVRSLSRQEFVFQEFVFPEFVIPEFVIQEFVTAPFLWTWKNIIWVIKKITLNLFCLGEIFYKLVVYSTFLMLKYASKIVYTNAVICIRCIHVIQYTCKLKKCGIFSIFMLQLFPFSYKFI